MLCQICNKRPANVYVSKVVNGEKTELHLCEECAKENYGLGIENEIAMFSTPFTFSNILQGFMDLAGSSAIPYTTQNQVRCPGCNLDYEAFKKTGRFGCSECYESFGARLEPLFKRIHGNTQHVGKVPKRSGGAIRIKRDIEKLKYELKKAIENEEYEKAAELRDKIKALESREEDK